MKGVSIVETELLESLIWTIGDLKNTVQNTVAELKQLKEPYLTTQEVMAITKFGEKWVQDNKDKIGFTLKGGKLIFKRKDVEAFMDEDYFQAQKPRGRKLKL
ncbi:helix-turn-helix domain-containing protein [Pedobacter gandavensis]|uniref:DNA-binding protein n=1 Tax=Pedobacter gandavensis TaxID=2679963 RepID=A0ABR6EUG4_9SPHI|nr:helix-turn-helix domain-containing protein [Pedobacter gandavensis]MBB2148837.1 hypothetical protein [Pedobacter gandavensis]